MQTKFDRKYAISQRCKAEIFVWQRPALARQSPDVFVAIFSYSFGGFRTESSFPEIWPSTLVDPSNIEKQAIPDWPWTANVVRNLVIGLFLSRIFLRVFSSGRTSGLKSGQIGKVFYENFGENWRFLAMLRFGLRRAALFLEIRKKRRQTKRRNSCRSGC